MKNKRNNQIKKIAFITEGALPVPPIKGGAVGELLSLLIEQNEIHDKYMFEVFSIYDEKIIERDLNNTTFTYLKCGKFFALIDSFIYFISKNILKSNKSEKFKYIFQRLNYLFKIHQIFNTNSYDVTLIEGNTTLLPIFKNKKRRNNSGKLVFHLHNDVGSIYNCKNVLDSLDLLIGNSKYVVENFKNYHMCCNETMTFILKNAIPPMSTSNGLIDIRKKYNISNDEKIVLYVGRLTEQKGILELIKVVANLSSNHKICLLVVGSALFGLKVKNAFEKELENIARKSNNRIIFAGYVQNNLLGNYYIQTDLSVFPSLYGEAAGMTIIEALSCGKPVISTNVGGIPEYVNNLDVILLSPNELDKNLGNSIISTLEANNEINHYNIEYIKTRYSSEVFYKDFCKAISKIYKEETIIEKK